MKFFRHFFTLSLVLFYSLLLANDSTLYSSQYEKEVFKKVADSVEVAALEIMIALDYEENNEVKVQEELDKLMKSLEAENFRGKKTKKQLNIIYKNVHSRLLKKYVEDADYLQIFEKGEYNCVSATALYAQVLEHFNIDYEIRETPTHVYLIADPKGTKTLIESTLPQNGTITYDYKTKKEYVEYLRSSKLVSEEEFKNNSIETLFDANFDKNKIINTKELAALLYYNKGVDAFNSSEFGQSSIYLAKAYQIYPSNTIKFLYNSSLSNELVSEASTKKFNPQALAQFLNLNSENLEYLGMGLDHFKSVGNELMINHPDINAYKSYYKTLVMNLSDSIEVDEYAQVYYYLLAYVYTMRTDYFLSLQNLNLAYISNPNNLEILDLINTTAAKYLLTDKNHEAGIDSLDIYFDIFPSLSENKGFQEYYAYCFMRPIREHIMYGKAKDGFELLKEYESFLDENPDFYFNEDYLADMYREISVYYIKKGQSSKAAQSIQKGLTYAPNSLMLINMQNELKAFTRQMSQVREEVVYTTIRDTESFEESIDKYFIACWEVDGILDRNMKETDGDKEMKIMIYKNNKASFKINGKLENGKYSIRNKSKLLYLIPDRNKDDYIIFKITRINSTELTLKPFVDGKLNGTSIYMGKCS